MAQTVKKLGPGKYKVRVYAGLDLNGRQRQKSKTFTATSDQAAERAARKTHIPALLEAVDERKAAAGTIGQLAAEWLELKARDSSPSTMASYRRIAKRIVDEFGRLKVPELTGRHIDAWYTQLAKNGAVSKGKRVPMSPANIQHHHAVLRAMLRQAERWDYADAVATRRSTPPKVPRWQHTVPTTGALVVMLNSTQGELGVALRLAAATGLRRGEVLGLRWSDLNGRRLHVVRSALEVKGKGVILKAPKGGRDRWLELNDDDVERLTAHRTEQARRAQDLGMALGDCHVFANLRADPKGQMPYNPSWLSHGWDELRKRHGVKIRLHDLRHWHATHLIDQGIPITSVSQRLGHAKTSTTLDIYAQAVAGSDTASAEVIRKALGPG